MIYSSPATPELSVSTRMGPLANLTASVDYLTWLGEDSSPWNDLTTITLREQYDRVHCDIMDPENHGAANR